MRSIRSLSSTNYGVRETLAYAQCALQKTRGLPCCHTIEDCNTYGGILQLSEVYPHWRFDRSDQSNVYDQYREVLDPLPVERRKGRPANQRFIGPAPQTNNRRELSHWEIVTPRYTPQAPSSTASVVQMRPASAVPIRFVPYEVPSSTAPAAARPASRPAVEARPTNGGDGVPPGSAALIPREGNQLRPWELLY